MAVKTGPTIRLKHPPEMTKIKAIAAKLKDVHVRVGYPVGSGEYPDGTPVIDVAIYNEFGTETIPERSFVRRAYRENKDKYANYLKRLASSLVKGVDVNIHSAMKAIGLDAVGDIQETIDKVSSPANAEITVLRKGSSHPLIDTGLLKQSTTFEVVGAKVA